MGAEHIMQKATLKGHADWVTAIACPQDTGAGDFFLSASRDKSIIYWNVDGHDGADYAWPKRALRGHSHFVQDVIISQDGQFALSCSWDGTLRLWDLAQGKTTKRFVGHTKDVLSVAFSTDNRQIVSGSRDKSIKLWNTLAECKYTITEEMHTDWVSSVGFSPSAKMPLIVSAGWDKLVKVWNLSNCKLRTNLVGHTGVVYATSISPDGSLCASGGKDGTAMLWDVNDGKHLYSLDAGGTINALTFSPENYWLVAATDTSIKVWDLENKNVLDELTSTAPPKNGIPLCVSLTWSADGNTLFAGSTDGNIYVYEVGNA